MKAIFKTAAKIAVSFGLLYFLSAYIDKGGLLTYAAAVLVFSIPAAINMASRLTLRKRAALYRYNEKSPFYHFFKGRSLGYSLIVIFSFITGLIVPVRLYTFSFEEFACLSLIYPLFIISKALAAKISLWFYKGDYGDYKAAGLSYALASILAALIFPLALYFLGAYDAEADRALQEAALTKLENNPLAYLIAYNLQDMDYVSALFLSSSWIRDLPIFIFALFLTILGGGGIIFYPVINFIGFFFLKKEDAAAVFKPVVQKEESGKERKFLYAFVATLLFAFIYPSLFVALNIITESESETVARMRQANKKAVEIIDGAMYEAGTLERIRAARAKAYGKTKEELLTAADREYDAMIEKTDDYLDWYYSMPAEYGRLLKMLTGSLENYMAKKLSEKISSEDHVTSALTRAEGELSQLPDIIEKILEENKVQYKNGEYSVAIDIDMADIYKKSEVAPAADIKNRLFVSAGGGAAAGALAGAVASKAAAKTGFKTAAKLAAKAAANKAVGAAAGAAVGIISGIFASPLGGIALGTATGLAIDKGMLELEQLIKRDEYKKEIVSAIEESRAETKAIITEAFKDEAP